MDLGGVRSEGERDIIGRPPARRRERQWLVTLLAIMASSSMALIGLWASQAGATASITPAGYQVAQAPTTTAAPTTTVPPTTTTVPPTTTTVSPPPPTTTTTAPKPAPVAAAAPAPGYGCGAALAYLAAHEAPGFSNSCPGPDDGHQATTTAWDDNGTVSGTIGIEVPCPAAYMNEAHNSWVLRHNYLGTAIPDGLGTVIDPYGYCH